MRAGKLDRRMKLRRKTETIDDFGQPIDCLNDIATVWAKWVRAKGADRWTAQQVVDTAAGHFEIRYLSDITPEDEIEFDDNQYDIIGQPEEIGRRQGWKIYVSRRVE